MNIVNTNYTIAKDIFNNVKYKWEVIPNIKNYIIELSKSLDEKNYNKLEDNIWIHKSVNISDKATIIGPCIIDENTVIRPGAYIRGNVIIGKNSVIGNSTEIKNSILFDNVQVPHFNYIGDSILGYKAHLGAGVIISNLKNDNSNIVIKGEDVIDTKLRKFGAIVGDNVNVGCNSVIFPGTIIYPNTDIYPLTRVRGVIKENSIVKDENTIIERIDK